MCTKVLWIKDEFLAWILQGQKSIEVRVGYSNITSLQPGDRLLLNNSRLFTLIRVTLYPDFEALLASEDVRAIAPGTSAEELLLRLRELYPPEKERLGAVALEIKPL